MNAVASCFDDFQVSWPLAAAKPVSVASRPLGEDEVVLVARLCGARSMLEALSLLEAAPIARPELVVRIGTAELCVSREASGRGLLEFFDELYGEAKDRLWFLLYAASIRLTPSQLADAVAGALAQ